MDLKIITFVTGNDKKLAEVVALLGAGLFLKIVSQKIDLPEYNGFGEPDKVCREKCLEAVRKVDGNVIVEHTCLSLNALDGLPGQYIEWYLDKLAVASLPGILCGSDKTADAVCTFGYCEG
jgi:inosine triphosphate pyrophosphatase